MDRDVADGQTGSLSGTPIAETVAVAAAPADVPAGEPVAAAEAPDSVASRLVRVFSKWTSPAGAAEDR